MAKINPQIHNKKHIAHLEQVRRQTQAIYIGSIVVAVLVIGIVLFGYLNENVFLKYRSVANVNGEKITVGEFQTQVKLQRVQLINQFTQYYQFAQMFGSQDPMNDQNFGSTLNQIYAQLQSPDEIGQNVLDALIDERLIRQEAKKRGITVSQEELDTNIQETFDYYVNGTPTPTVTATVPVMPTLNPTQLAIVTITPTSTELITQTPTATPTTDPLVTPTQTLVPTATATTEPTATAGPTSTAEPTATPYTLEGFNTRYKESYDGYNKETGINEADYRKLFEGMLLRKKLQEAVTADLKPFEEQVWARHILVATEEEAKAIIESLKSGTDWVALAAEKSLDTSNSANGGDLSWFGKGAMVAPFEEAAYALKAGEISAPVQTDFGWHIIQVLGHEDRALTAQEYQDAIDAAFSTWLQEQRTTATIVIASGWIDYVPAEPTLEQAFADQNATITAYAPTYNAQLTQQPR
jgi:parvulin-like peptidyl-prolyl isomerase